MKPINQFDKNDYEEQPLLVLKSDNGLLFIGEWDNVAGMFFIDTLIEISYNEEQLDYISRMEIPGRFYNKVVEYLHLTDWKHGAN